VRATLHDDLMREAGFESDYHAELERRREQRRRKLQLDFLRAVRAVAVVAVLLAAVLPLLDIVRGSAVVLRAPYLVLVPFMIGWAADFLLDRMRGEGEPKGLLRRFFWRCYRAGVRASKRAAHRLGSEA
jgi:hypothetical protein